MRTLGVVLAGGRSSRFGSDKAEAVIGSASLLEHAIAALRPYCDEIVVAGRSVPDILCTGDWPTPGLGPLGGLAGALGVAESRGFDQVMSVPVDCVFLPEGIRGLLEPASSYIDRLPVVGLWHVRHAALLREILVGGSSRSVKGFAARADARPVAIDALLANVNTPRDLAVVERMMRER